MTKIDEYGNEVTTELQNLHRQRRMFAIIENQLFITEKGDLRSHLKWFIDEGWINNKNDIMFAQIVRGFVSLEGDIYFYKGLNFTIDTESQEELLKFLTEIVEKLKLNPKSKIFGGMIKQGKTGKWPPKIYLGTIKEILHRR